MRGTILIDPSRTIGEIDPKLYGQFLSRRRWVADGALYDPSHPDAGADGLRGEVVDAIAAAAPPIMRWPGGCTGTSYDWKDGVGAQDERLRTIDAHFGYDVGNGFGTAEFIAFCRRIGAAPLLNLNTGLGTLREALEWLEYANFTTPSRWAELRRSHGHDAPFDVRHWQIGNEEYGPWEIGHQSPAEYATMAREWAKTLKKMDPDLQIVAVGGSQRGSEWDYTVLREAWDHIDYLTAHRYWDFDSFAGDDRYDTIAGVGYLEEQTTRAIGEVIELVARDRRSERRPRIAFTEWNCRDLRQREMSPEWRPFDTQYRLVDALAVAGFLNMMQRQCRHVGLATFAQSINVVGMLLVTDEQVVRETVYWPLRLMRQHCGTTAVDAWVDCEGYSADFEGRAVHGIPYLDVSASFEAPGRLVLSVVNRHRTEAMETRIQARDAALPESVTLHRLWHEDPFARNTVVAPNAVQPTTEVVRLAGDGIELALPPHSWTLIELDLAMG